MHVYGKQFSLFLKCGSSRFHRPLGWLYVPPMLLVKSGTTRCILQVLLSTLRVRYFLLFMFSLIANIFEYMTYSITVYCYFVQQSFPSKSLKMF
jgi:hypothetical protein